MKLKRFMENVKKQDKFFLILLFAFSVLIRLPNLNRPISKHHEFNLAFALIPMDIWKAEGLRKHGFLPPYNYSNPADKNIMEPVGIEHGNVNGTFYYLSFPVLAYLIPYGMIELLHLPVNPLSIQIINLLLHLLSGFFLFGILRRVFNRKQARIGILFFFFSASTLWFYGNAYVINVFAQFLWIVALYLFIRFILEKKTRLLFYLFLSLLGSLLTEWISVFIAGSLLFISFLYLRKEKQWIPITRCIILALFTGFILLYIQHDSFMGWEKYMQYLQNRFAERSFTNADKNYGQLLFQWIKWTFLSYGPWILFIAAGFVLPRIFNHGNMKSSPLTTTQKILLFSCLFPALAHHMIFKDFTIVHDFSVLTDSLFWACMAGMAYPLLGPKKYMPFVYAVLLTLSVSEYYYINRPGNQGQNGDSYSIYKNIGQTIRETAQPDEMIFITGFDVSVRRINPQINYYAKRNFIPVSGKEEALGFMHKHRFKKGKVYFLEQGTIQKIVSLR